MNVCSAVAVLATALALVVPGLARAEERPPAIDQYVEHIPTSSGSEATGRPRPTGRPRQTGPATATGGGTATESGSSLPAVVERRLSAQGGNDRALLRGIATSPALGAPEKVRIDKAERVRLKEVRKKQAAKPLSAAVGAVTETGDGRVLALLIAMGAMTALALAAAGLQRRAVRPPRSR
jgi:hypothetical protein